MYVLCPSPYAGFQAPLHEFNLTHMFVRNIFPQSFSFQGMEATQKQ